MSYIQKSTSPRRNERAFPRAATNGLNLQMASRQITNFITSQCACSFSHWRASTSCVAWHSTQSGDWRLALLFFMRMKQLCYSISHQTSTTLTWMGSVRPYDLSVCSTCDFAGAIKSCHLRNTLCGSYFLFSFCNRGRLGPNSFSALMSCPIDISKRALYAQLYHSYLPARLGHATTWSSGMPRCASKILEIMLRWKACIFASSSESCQHNKSLAL